MFCKDIKKHAISVMKFWQVSAPPVLIFIHSKIFFIVEWLFCRFFCFFCILFMAHYY